MMVVWPWGLIYNLKCIVLQLLIWVCLKIGVAYFGPQNNIEIVEFRRKPVLFRTPQYCPQPMGAQKGFSIYVLSAVQRPPALLRSVEQFLQANCEWLDSRFQLVLLCDLWGLCSTIAGVAHWKVWASDCFFFWLSCRDIGTPVSYTSTQDMRVVLGVNTFAGSQAILLASEAMMSEVMKGWRENLLRKLEIENCRFE